MEQSRFIRNISGTVCVLGIALSAVNANSTILIDGNYHAQWPKSIVQNSNCSNALISDASNIYRWNNGTRLENEATSLFGAMRDASQHERDCVNSYIRSISKKTGVSFFDIC